MMSARLKRLCLILGGLFVLSCLLYLYVSFTIVGPFHPRTVVIPRTSAGGEEMINVRSQGSTASLTLTRNVSSAGSLSRSTPTGASGKEEWYASVERRFKERLQRVQEACKRNGNPTPNLFATYRKRLYFSDRYNLMVCLTPKVATSTWMVHLHHIRGVAPNTSTLHGNYWKNQIKACKVLGGVSSVRRRAQTALNIMTTRHPLERLLSAFRDKFAGGRRLVRPQSYDHYRYFWKPALKALKKPIHTLQVTFPEFLRFAMMHSWEPHWVPVFETCSPCSFSYRYVMRLETFTEDLRYLREKLAIKDIDLSQNFNAKATSEGSADTGVRVTEVGTLPKNSTIQHFLQVPTQLLAQVIGFYKMDLEAFGYQVPPQVLSQVLNLTQVPK
ncbi:carbohydrate sulfotransferase 8-like [Panulirus ornatus]|uniref:carbohydrate sulfotransferase 8-like n=1 Tax=Panulirus ornatus TaxID=150431 RepID=UPI003A8AB549